MKKKFGLFALVLTVLLCGSLFLFAACGDGEEEEPSATPAISVTVNETARQSGATIEGDTEDTYTIAASVVNGEEGASVTISYVYESGEAETFTGSTFSPDEAGTYVFTFTAEGASNFTLTFEIAEAQAPVVPVITASADRNEITAGGQVTLTWSATENAQVTVTYTKGGESASALQPVSGEAFTIADAGVYVFTFAAEGAKPVTVTVTVTATHTHVWATEWTIKPATATEEGKASRACIASGCTDPVEVQEVTLPALNSDDAKDFYTVTVKTPATCTEKGVSTYAWVSNDDIAFDVTGEVSYEQSAHGTSLSFFDAKAATCTEAGEIAYAHCTACGKYYKVDGNTIEEEILEGENGLTDPSRPATGHSYAVSFDTEEDYTTALGTADGQYTVDCANECGTETTIALPALTAENTWTKSEEVAATCMNPGTATFTATVSSVTVVVKGVQTAPATGHSYVVSYEGTTLSAVCEKGDSTVTATVTISGGDGATGTTEFGSDAFSFADGTFTVTLPQNAFEKEGFSFSGWLVGEEIKQADDSATVAENGKLVITAQWTEVTTPTISARADKTEIYAGEQVTLTWSLTGGEGEVTVTYTKDEVPADTLKPVSGEAFAINEVGVYKFTFTAVDAEAVTVTVTVKENVITLSVTLGGELVDGVENDGSATVCIGTEIGYIATVTGGGSVTGVYIYEDGVATDLASAEGTFPFEDIGTYRFTFSADGADPYTYTVEVIAHDYTGQPYISAGEEGHYQVCKNCNVAHSETVAHTYGDTVLFAEGVASVSCTECAEKQSVTVTMNGNEGTGEMTLTAENFSYEEGSFVLILPQNDYTAPANCWFYAWSIGAKEYFAGEEAKIAVGNEVTITAEWEQLSVGETGTDISLGRWAQPLTYPLNLTNGKSFMLTAQLGGTFASGEFYEGIYVVVHDTEADPFVFRPDNWWFYSNYNPDNSYANKTVTREVTIQFNGNAGLGSAADFQKVKAENRTQIVVSKENGVITIKYNFINTENTPVVQSTYTINNLAENTLLEFCYDGVNITANDVSISGDVMISNNQAPTSDVPVMIGSDNAGADVDAWVSVIKKGTKVVISGTQTSSATENWFTAGVGLFSDLTARAYFRGDNYVDNTTSEDANVTHDLAYEGWHITKQMSHENDWNAFKSMIADCEQTITIDWTNESQIMITFVYEKDNASMTQSYVITASGENILANQYYFSIGYNSCTMVVNNIVRTHA